MKVLMLNGSGRINGCTRVALDEIARVLKEEGIDSEIVSLATITDVDGNSHKEIMDCIGCGACRKLEGRCAFGKDGINELIAKAEAADGFIFGTPVYYAHPSGRLLSVLDRMFFACGRAFAYKPGAAVASARRGGTTASLDAVNKYFGIGLMPTVPSTYWNMVHGSTPEEVRQDKEGLQTMRNLGKNMAWMLKCVEAGRKQGIEPPAAERGNWTNFIR